MAVDVTIVSQYRDEDYFQSKNSALYAYSSVPSGGIGLSWSGNTANAVGTYGSATTIIAEPNFRFDAETDALFVGTIPTAHGSNAAYSMTLGTDTASEFGQFEFSGHQFIDGRLGGISFHNELATRSDKMVADFYVERNGANYTGNFHLDIANASHTMIPVYDVGYTQHEWWTNNISRMTLSITALYSEATADLGRTTDPWGYLYVSNIRDAALAGTGTRVVLADTDGDLTTSVLLFDGAALYPSVSGVDLGRDTDGERFQKI